MKKALRMGDLFHPETTKARLADIVAYKNLTIEGVYGRPPVSADDMWAWLVEYGDILKPLQSPSLLMHPVNPDCSIYSQLQVHCQKKLIN